MKLGDADLEAIGNLIRVVLNEELDEILDEKLGHLPNKNEFYASQDELAKEIRDLRDEVTTRGEQVRRNTRRIEKLESKAGIVAS